MKNIIMKRKGEYSWVTWIKKRVKHNLNFMCIFEGPPGIGKSWGALSIAEKIDPDFIPEQQVAFNFRDLMRIINNFNGESETLKKKEYKVIIFDEAQTDLSNRDWQSKVNKLFNYLATTFRHQNIILLFTSPYSDFLDSATMKLLHAKFEVKGWSKKTKKTTIRPKLLQYNSKLKKFYEHSLHVIGDGKVDKLTIWSINKPSEHLIIPYEEMKNEFTTQLNKRITEDLEEMGREKDKPKVEVVDTRKELTARQREIMELLGEHDSNLKVAEILNCNPNAVSIAKKYARKKGYKVEEFRRMKVITKEIPK